MKTPIGEILYKDEDFCLTWEKPNGYAVCHAEVYRTAPSVVKRFRGEVANQVSLQKEDGYVLCDKRNTKLKRFLKLVGFKYVRNLWRLDAQGDNLIVELWGVNYHDKNSRKH